VTQALLPGMHLIELTTHEDERGSFTETFRQAWLPGGVPPMVQANLSFSRVGALRGLHVHRRQADFWCVVQGSAFIALFDVRAGSPTEGRAWTDTFDAARGLRGLYIPPGVAHGFCALSDVRLLYMVDAYYTGDDEEGFAWNDPDLQVAWPLEKPILSPRDADAAPLSEAIANRPRFAG
jgi:dTDP-4-dehydrorhamnose 3,5-epimerase